MASERYIYALTDWTVEKRTQGWYYTRSARRHARADWRGPYRSEASVAMMIARQLQREIIERHGRQINGGVRLSTPDEARFLNYYRCADCGHEWTDEWSCQCDDDCPTCGARHMSPHQSDDLSGAAP